MYFEIFRFLGMSAKKYLLHLQVVHCQTLLYAFTENDLTNFY